MNRYLYLFSLILFCCSNVVLAKDIPPQNQNPDPTYLQLTPYYNQMTDGMITPIAPGLPEDYPAQDYYKLDVARFNTVMGAPDFLESSRRFYGSLNFNKKTQMHEQPYYYMASWRVLFHPPIKKLDLPVEEYNRDFSAVDKSKINSDYFDPEFQKKLDSLSGTEMSFGNELDLLPDSHGYNEKMRMIKEAKHSFWAVVMVFFCHEASSKMADEMIKKHKEGVDVRLIVEGLWSSLLVKKCIAKFKKAGVPVVKLSTVLNPKSFTAVMHHKFWIKDNEEAIIGGQNFHDYSNLSDGFNNLTRDTDVRVRGPAVTDMARQYMILWNKYADKMLPSIKSFVPEVQTKMQDEYNKGIRGIPNYSKWLGDPNTRMKGACRFLVQRPNASEQAIGPILEEYAKHAKNHIVVSSPSVRFKNKINSKNWEDRFASILKAKASGEGVKVDVISNGIQGGDGDLSAMIRQIQTYIGGPTNLINELLQDFDRANMRNGAKKNREPLLNLAKAPNLRSWAYFQFIHAKQHMFDRVAASIGSFNFDGHSGNKNHESTLICLDDKLTGQLENQLTLDMINSVPVVSANGK